MENVCIYNTEDRKTVTKVSINNEQIRISRSSIPFKDSTIPSAKEPFWKKMSALHVGPARRLSRTGSEDNTERSMTSDRQFFSNFKFSIKVLIQMISNVKKKSLRKIKYGQRNGSFTFWQEHTTNSDGLRFWPEVKITRLIDIFSTLEVDTVKLKWNLFDCFQRVVLDFE